MNEAALVLPPALPLSPPANAKPRVWPAFVAFALLLLLGILAAGVMVGFVAGFVDGFKHGAHMTEQHIRTEAIRAAGILSGFASTMAIAAGIALMGAWLSPMFWRDRLRLRPGKLQPLILIVGTLGIMSAGMILTSCMQLGWLPHSKTLDMLDHMLKELPLGGAITSGLLLGLLPGFCEELLFRGYIQTRLVARWGAVWGIFWTALMFGIMHMDLMQGLFAVVIGCLLGFITVRSGSIIPAIICHASNNLTSMLLAITTEDSHSHIANYVVLLIGLIILPLAILYLRAHLPPAKAKSAA